MQAGRELVFQRSVHQTLAGNAALSLERSRHDLDTEMRFAHRARAGDKQAAERYETLLKKLKQTRKQ